MRMTHWLMTAMFGLLAFGLCWHQYRPDTGSATGIGSNRRASRWAPAGQSLERDTGLRVG